MSKSEQSLKEAFAGESQANRKYLAFAKKAEDEGHIQAARMFRAAAEAETVHALNHLRALGGIKSTAENLKSAIEGETYEFTEMYPGMLVHAKDEKNKAAIQSFNYANEVEKTHAKLYKEVQDNLGKKADLFAYYVCPVCGHTEPKHAPDVCPVCGTAGDKFKKIE